MIIYKTTEEKNNHIQDLKQEKKERGGYFFYRLHEYIYMGAVKKHITVIKFIEMENQLNDANRLSFELKSIKDKLVYYYHYITSRGTVHVGEYHNHPNNDSRLSKTDYQTYVEKRKRNKNFRIMIITSRKVKIYGD